jgi:hypothetical protein
MQAPGASERDVALEAAAESQNIRADIDGRTPSQALTSSSCAAAEARTLIDAYLVRVAVRSDKLQIEYRTDHSDPHAIETLSVPWTKPEKAVVAFDPRIKQFFTRGFESETGTGSVHPAVSKWQRTDYAWSLQPQRPRSMMP